MKTKFKSVIIFLSIMFLIHLLTTRVINPGMNYVKETVLKNDTIKEKSYKVTATMYYPVASQCDSDPTLTAGMFRIPENASEQKWIAMSRDMIARWGGEFHYGDTVQIEGAGHKDGIYKVVDTMNKRFKNRIDFLESKGTDKYKFENVTLTKIHIKWNSQTLKENLLASL